MTRNVFFLFGVLGVTMAAGPAQAETPAQPKDIQMVVVSPGGYFEYTKDGVPLVGLITRTLAAKKVSFTTCDNKTLEVALDQLQKSSRDCTPAGGDVPFWRVGWTADSKTLGPVFRASSSDKVLIQNQEVDLKAISQWKTYAPPLPAAAKDEPIGFLFKDAQGRVGLTILDKAAQPDWLMDDNKTANNKGANDKKPAPNFIKG